MTNETLLPTALAGASYILLGLGLLFDLLSLVFQVRSRVVKRHESGFPFVGLVFYLLAVLIPSQPLIMTPAAGILPFLGAKLVDLLALAGVHVVCHVVMIGEMIGEMGKGKID